MGEKLTLREMVEALNKKAGSNMFCEKMGNLCLEFYYGKVIIDGWSLIDADEMVNKLRTDLWEHDIEVLELNRNAEDRKLIEESAERCGAKLDWMKWKEEPLEEYKYF